MLHSEILKLDKLESTSPKDMQKLVNSIVKSKLPFNDLLLQCGMYLYLNRQDLLGENVYTVIDSMMNSAMENKKWGVVKLCEHILLRAFSEDPKLWSNHATFHHALGRTKVATIRLNGRIEKNLLDVDCHKKRLAITRASDNIPQFISDLNDYIDKNPLDKEAWGELADVYMEYMNYDKALFCYEELLILDPENLNNMMRVGELYYTLGNSGQNDNLSLARKYFSFILSVENKNLRASYNLKQTTKVLLSLKKEVEVNQPLKDYAEWNIKQIYKDKNSKLEMK